MPLAEAPRSRPRAGGVPFSPSAGKRTSKEGRDRQDLNELKAALRGLQASGPRAGLGARPKPQKEAAAHPSPTAGAEEVELHLHFGETGEPRLRLTGLGLDLRPRGGGREAPEDLLEVAWEDEDPLCTDRLPSSTDWLLAAMEAPMDTTLCLDEDLVDVWNEDDGEPGQAPASFREAPRGAEVEERMQRDQGGTEDARRTHLNREFASHFVQAVMDSTLIQAVTGHRRMVTPRRAPPTMGPGAAKASPRRFGAAGDAPMTVPLELELDLDTAHLEAAGLAEMEQRLEAALDLQLSVPPSPAASARPLQPLVPPSPEDREAACSWEVLHLEAGMDLQLDPPAPSCLPAAEVSQQRSELAIAAAGTSEPPAVVAEPAGSPPSRPVSRGGLRPSKSHRRIIGGVVRTPAPAESEYGAAGHSIERAAAAAVPPPPRPQPRAEAVVGSRVNVSKASKHARHSGRESPSGSSSHRGAAVVYRMDFDEPSLLLEGGAAVRGSSLAGRYDALGAELFSMQDEADFAQAAAAEPPRHSASASFCGQQTSAMALDLGEDVARSSSFSYVAAPTALSHQQISKCVKRSPSASSTFSASRAQAQQGVGSPARSVVKPKKQGLLPDLPGAPCSGSLAWTRRLNRPASRCALGGRGSLASAF